MDQRSNAFYPLKLGSRMQDADPGSIICLKLFLYLLLKPYGARKKCSFYFNLSFNVGFGLGSRFGIQDLR
jgi:hypothetical protein